VTIIEVLIGMTVVLIAMMGMMGSLSSSAVLGDSARETALAYQAAQLRMERLQTEDFGALFALYNDTNADDPPGAAGRGFAVAGLELQAGDPDGLVGTVVLPSSGGLPGSLREDAVDPSFGLPRDLNGDGELDGASHEDDYIVLPVRVRVEWRGRSGNRFVELQSLLRQG
jgi:hypothetical protein